MLNKETLKFLKLIIENNNREWFAEHKHLYEAAKEDLMPFIAELIKEFAKIDPQYSPDTPAKKALMRIYRDVRFSKNKDPYKKNFGIAFDVKGFGPITSSYYLHLEPNNCFFGVGFWQPEAVNKLITVFKNIQPFVLFLRKATTI